MQRMHLSSPTDAAPEASRKSPREPLPRAGEPCAASEGGQTNRKVSPCEANGGLAKRHARTPADEEAKAATRRLLRSVVRRTHISTAALLLALFFIHRYRLLPRADIGAPGSQFRMFLIGLLLAHKYSEDHPYSNRVWAQLSEIPIIHVNSMERDFLHRIDHRLTVPLPDFKAWVVALDRRFGWSLSSAERRRDYRAMPLPPAPPGHPGGAS
jgi:hypothetical protein